MQQENPSTDLKVSATHENLFLKSLENVPMLHTATPENALTFLIATDKLRNMLLVPEVHLLQCLVTKCTNLFLDILTQVLQDKPDYMTFKIRVLQYVCPPRTLEQCKHEYIHRFQRPNESLPVFIESICSYERALNLDLSEALIVQIIIDNLNPLTKQHLPPGNYPSTLADLRIWSIQVESNLRATADFFKLHPPADMQHQSNSNVNMEHSAQLFHTTPVSHAPTLVKNVKHDVVVDTRASFTRCSNCTRYGHRSFECRQAFIPHEQRSCFGCKRAGHIMKDCPTRKFHQGNGLR